MVNGMDQALVLFDLEGKKAIEFHKNGNEESLAGDFARTGTRRGPMELTGQTSQVGQGTKLMPHKPTESPAKAQALLAKLSVGKFRALHIWKSGVAPEGSS